MSRKFNPANITEAQKEDIISATNNYADSIKRDLDKEPSFKDMIKDSIQGNGKEKVYDVFNSLKYMWELSGRDISKADEVYNEYFILREDYSKVIYVDEINHPKVSHQNAMEMFKKANNNIGNKQIEEKPDVEVELQSIEYLGIILMCILVLYFIIESIFRMFSDGRVFYFWGYYNEVYKLSGMLLVFSFFGLNHYYSKSKELKQVIDDLWQIILKFKTLISGLLELKTVQNALIILVGILGLMVVASLIMGGIYALIEYWYLVVGGIILFFIYAKYKSIKK
ncbi:hypothetical protein [Gelidibacter gilvus]|uniref:Uncharacterized protein n=1 Tax=Gelidibacter gilvus TaxID=59602 RepID=A0A4Q0XLS6_9FLAO|nr:hypothetical protein [Gelidibacter gilvus]RXJ52637.1 hypothetical protein ESZ48_02790 [Gelidibacter gilvus]